MAASPSIAVVIAAYNAEDTIGRAVGSAMASPHVAEVIVVDDLSTDGTVEAARQAARTDSRLAILRQDRNQGPSAARNRALRESRAPFVAVLDADDYLLPGRFEAMLAKQDWDLCADNIIFVQDDPEAMADEPDPTADCEPCHLSFETFVLGNISKRNRWRGELGFLKTLMRRDFLEQHGLSYDEDCRLGEDFLLYTQALAKGARFKILGRSGYAALLRNNSLSSRHGAPELGAYVTAEKRILDTFALTASERGALRRHLASMRRKWVHRVVLDKKKRSGLVSGLATAAMNPSAVVDIMLDYLAPPNGATDSEQRHLLSPSDLQRLRQ